MSAMERLRAVKAGKKNVGGTERLLRGTVGPALVVVGAAALVGLVTLAAGTLGLALSLLSILAGVRMTQTALTQRCYMNALLGRDSCRRTGVDAPRGTEAVDRG